MREQPNLNAESVPSRLSLEELNAIIKQGKTVEVDFVFGLPKFKPEPIIPSAHDWSYYSFEEDSAVRRFAENFLNSVSPSAKTEELIENATKYVVENIRWIGKESTRSISELVEKGNGSCTAKSVLLAYLMHKLGLESYTLAGYARNVAVDNCPELKARSGAYKAGSRYQQNLFNLPLEPREKPTGEDVGHAWVGVQTKDGVVYADPTTGLVSTTPAEKEIFSAHYKTLPLAYPDFIEGVEMTTESQHSYLDLDFNEPVQKIHAKVSNNISAEWGAGSTLILEGPEDTEVKLKSPLLGFEIIGRSAN